MDRTGSKGHLSTSLAAGTIRPDSFAAAAADVELERIHSVSFGEMQTKTVLEVGAAAVVGNSSNFDSLECREKRKKRLLTQSHLIFYA